LVSGFYVLGVVLLGFHLSHAVQSMFQTLGFNNPKYFGTIEKASGIFGVAIALALISIPVSILLGFGGNL
jgi:succinate dehydrogenase / fumarate reductase cytochrome b subunit